MSRNIWTRALWGGIIGTAVKDAIMLVGRSAGWIRVNWLAAMARLFTTAGVSTTSSGMILGFVIDLLLGAILAIIFVGIVRAFHSRHNIIAGLIYGLLLWLIAGAAFAPSGIAAAPWTLGTGTTVGTLIGMLAYGLVLGWMVSEDVVTRTSGQ
ncbi:MAG: DUF6789 family protein [Bacillota bacterium]